MKFTLALLSGLVASTVSGLAIPNADPEAVLGVTASQTDADIIRSTALSWYADTAMVSYFLDNIAAGKFRSQSAYLAAALAALAAEEAELQFEQILNQELSDYECIKASNSTLADGSWDNIKSLFQQLTQLDYKKDSAKINSIVSQINFGNSEYGGRCNSILPAIDSFLTSAYKALQDKNTPGYTANDKSLKNYQRAVRAKACGAQKRDTFEMDVETVEDILA